MLRMSFIWQNLTKQASHYLKKLLFHEALNAYKVTKIVEEYIQLNNIENDSDYRQAQGHSIIRSLGLILGRELRLIPTVATINKIFKHNLHDRRFA